MNINKIKIFTFVLIVFLIFAVAKVFFNNTFDNRIFHPKESIPFEDRKNINIVTPKKDMKDIEVIAENLDVPWSIEFLPEGDLLVTERNGRIIRVGNETKTIEELSGVYKKGEAGLMGLTLHPQFEQNKLVYLMVTLENGTNIENQVERYKLEKDTFVEKKVLLSKIDGAIYHDGGRIRFGPDGYLYITTGDATREDLSQNKNSLNGKILRVTDEGKPVLDNPFGNEVYSYGHRNPQGITWDNQGNLWSSEHGPSGTNTGFDEINLIIKGANYGWPGFIGREKGAGITSAVIQSGEEDTWAPASLEYFDGSLFFGGLRGEALYEARINSLNNLSLKAHFKKEFGRIREVKLGPDGYLYITTSNRDGRGEIRSSDDKIIRVNPKIFR
jgi:glucose/arabinose dehydrogenase